MVDTRDGQPDLALAEKPAGLILVHLADALGVSLMRREDFQRRRGPNRGAVFVAIVPFLRWVVRCHDSFALR
jgi:hypothetical protein